MKLEEMFEIQKNLQEKLFSVKLPDDEIEGFKYSLLALIAELGEVLEADGRWKNVRKKELKAEEKLYELVDCMAFLINMVLYSGFTVKEFSEAFVKKSIQNLERDK